MKAGKKKITIICENHLRIWRIGFVPCKYALFFHRLSILERAPDHERNSNWINCNRREYVVCVKISSVTAYSFFSERRRAKKPYLHICYPAPSSPSLHPPTHTSSLWFPPPSPHFLIPLHLCCWPKQISRSGALAGLFPYDDGWSISYDKCCVISWWIRAMGNPCQSVWVRRWPAATPPLPGLSEPLR
jgi:hypothetical protein